MKEFVKWDSAAAAVGEIGALLDGKVPPMLAGLMESIKDEKKVSLAVADKNIGVALQRLPGLTNITTLASGSATTDLYRGIRTHLSELIPGILPENFQTMSLGLSHSLSRHKLRFSADKVDVMIIQAINLLDDLDKELNTYAMRVKEWYGWHFPELGKILNDNMAYAKVIQKMGLRSNAPKTDLSEVLPEEIEAAVKAAADLSMGTEISEEDLENITLLADQVVSYSEYRGQLSAYLEARMRAIAPSLTELVGYLVGARLIAHAGSLMNLAKNPGSTIQILGAEKALFRALKTKHATPKYGLIYHASLVGQATGKNKGKIARQLAAKAALGVRVDALTEYKDDEEADEEARSVFGAAQRAKIENNLRRLEGKPILAKGITVGPNGNAAPAPGKWDVKEARKYNADADGLAGNGLTVAEAPAKESKKDKKKDKKERKKSKKEATPEDVDMENGVKASDEEMNDAPAKAADGTYPLHIPTNSARDYANIVSFTHQPPPASQAKPASSAKRTLSALQSRPAYPYPSSRGSTSAEMLSLTQADRLSCTARRSSRRCASLWRLPRPRMARRGSAMRTRRSPRRRRRSTAAHDFADAWAPAFSTSLCFSVSLHIQNLGAHFLL